MKKLEYSKNFIVNKKLVKYLINESNISKTDMVFDIGAGHGELTGYLNKKCKIAIAIEKDETNYKQLIQKFKHESNVKVIKKDIFEFKFPKRKKYKIFSNIPFTYTSNIVRKLTEYNNPGIDIYLFMQKEAALNYLGQKKSEGLKSLFTKAKFKPEIIYNFKRKDFRPIPKIDIVLLRLRLKNKPLINIINEDEWKDFVVFGFSQCKASVKESFKKVFSKTQFIELSKILKLKLNNKPSDLSLKQWVSLYYFFNLNIDKKKKALVKGSYLRLTEQQYSLNKIHRTRTDKNWRQRRKY